MLKICLLTNQDLNQVALDNHDWPCDPRPFYKNALWSVEVLHKKNSISHVKRLVKEGYDLFFNLCDGAQDEKDNPGVEVIQTLESLKVPFTGADSSFFEPSRKKMKDVCDKNKIKTPSHVFVQSHNEISKVLDHLGFPMIVKHYSSYASIGLSRWSRVTSEKMLKMQIRKICNRYGSALIEEFIEGKECTVLVGEDESEKAIAYTPIEYSFPKGESFKHEAIKWKDFNSVDAFPVKDKKLSKILKEQSLDFFKSIKGVSYGRCDFRIDQNDQPYFLEVNPNCGLYYPNSASASADICLLAEPDGHKKFTSRIIKSALKRHQKIKPVTKK